MVYCIPPITRVNLGMVFGYYFFTNMIFNDKILNVFLQIELKWDALWSSKLLWENSESSFFRLQFVKLWVAHWTLPSFPQRWIRKFSQRKVRQGVKNKSWQASTMGLHHGTLKIHLVHDGIHRFTCMSCTGSFFNMMPPASRIPSDSKPFFTAQPMSGFQPGSVLLCSFWLSLTFWTLDLLINLYPGWREGPGRNMEELASQAELLPGETSSGLVRFQRSKNRQGIYVRQPQFSLVN